MPYCVILECKNDSRNVNLSKGGVSYHRFPKDPNIKSKWIDATGRQNWFPRQSSTICSKHFEDEDFLIKKSGNKFLTEKAIPSRNVLFFQSDADMPLGSISIKEEPNPEPSSPPLRVDRKLDYDISSNENENIRSEAPTQMDKKQLLGVLRWNEEKIKKQGMEIRRLRARNRRLSLKVQKLEDKFNALEEKFFMSNENVTTHSLKNTNVKK